VIETLFATLTTYGGVGVLAAILLWDKLKTQERLRQVVQENTRVISSIETLILNCDFTKKK
jgi:hypothetical protein